MEEFSREDFQPRACRDTRDEARNLSDVLLRIIISRKWDDTCSMVTEDGTWRFLLRKKEGRREINNAG